MCTTTLNPETASVAQYLESKRAYRAVGRIVAVWELSNEGEQRLARELKALVYSVMKRSNSEIDLEEVDWLFLAQRYAELFG